MSRPDLVGTAKAKVNEAWSFDTEGDRQFTTHAPEVREAQIWDGQSTSWAKFDARQSNWVTNNQADYVQHVPASRDATVWNGQKSSWAKFDEVRAAPACCVPPALLRVSAFAALLPSLVSPRLAPAPCWAGLRRDVMWCADPQSWPQRETSWKTASQTAFVEHSSALRETTGQSSDLQKTSWKMGEDRGFYTTTNQSSFVARPPATREAQIWDGQSTNWKIGDHKVRCCRSRELPIYCCLTADCWLPNCRLTSVRVQRYNF